MQRTCLYNFSQVYPALQSSGVLLSQLLIQHYSALQSLYFLFSQAFIQVYLIMMSSTSCAEQDQRGLLREDLDLLCYFLGIEFVLSSTENRDELSDTQEAQWKEQSLSEAAMINDALLISIEIIGSPEHLLNGNDGSYQFGLSILDTRQLKAVLSYNAIMSYPAFVAAGSSLQTHHFCIGSTDYFNITSSSFSFGTSKHVTIPELRFSLRELLSGREVLLIVNNGHGPEGALTFLQAAQIILQPFPIIETQKTTPNHPNHPDKNYVSSLTEFFYNAEYEEKYYDLTVNFLSLGCVAHRFTSDTKHNAGNASRYTLCLLLDLFTLALDTRSSPWLTPLRPTLAALKSIANAPYKQLSMPPSLEHSTGEEMRPCCP